MNGQLMLLMLVEKLIKAGYKIIQCNTDGVFVFRLRSEEEKFQQICKEWETLTKLTLEEDKFEEFYQFAVNDYLGIKEGYKETKNSKLLKKKGLFIDTVSLGKGMNAMIIPEAINKYLADNIPIQETICNCRDLKKFLTFQKVSRGFSVEYNNNLITHINRYYVSTNGAYLYKCKLDKDGKRSGYINMLSGHGVIIANDLNEIKEFPNDINYKYYISEANKIITRFTHKQLNLF